MPMKPKQQITQAPKPPKSPYALRKVLTVHFESGELLEAFKNLVHEKHGEGYRTKVIEDLVQQWVNGDVETNLPVRDGFKARKHR